LVYACTQSQASTGFFGAVFLESGQSGDLAFEALAPGTYFLVCGVETADGTPPDELGMVSRSPSSRDSAACDPRRQGARVEHCRLRTLTISTGNRRMEGGASAES
jgi:hypothetical protein